MRNKKTNFIVKTAILGALAGVLMFIKFPIPIAPSFYKLDFSDICGLLGGFAIGPFASIVICLIKNIINVSFEGTVTAFIGEISNFIMSACFCGVAALVYKKEHTKKGAIKSLIIASFCLVLISAVINYYVLIPAFVKFMNIPLEAIISMGSAIIPSINSLFTLVLLCTVPFNLIKAVLVSLITYIVYKRVSPLLK